MGTRLIVKPASRKPRPCWNVDRIVEDMALRGMNGSDLARATGFSAMTISKFLRGQYQTAKVAAKIAVALGYGVRRYLSGVERVA